ncbi:tyrosine-type recombinase/integrase [Spirosoma panaciterrae]|uniref:tyrosine-type recombinase/integrase n=1 Tax=Spirosoma panaciterrae TaxID=496058 RepID=UPI000377DCF9|nr:tyrosine-type recombinase/integrase [Spirosoma panaciterrae]
MGKSKKTTAKPTAMECIQHQALQFDSQLWSKPYLRDMNRVTSELLEHLVKSGLAKTTLEDITPKVLSEFLNNFRSSGRYYMNKRRNLSALFRLLMHAEDLPANPVARTLPMKTKEILNEAFTPEQLMPVLNHLKASHPNLYLCALLTYGTLLRPHREIRLLQRKDFDATFDFITLSGKATKSGRIRKVPVPDYIKACLISRGIESIAPEAYIVTGTTTPVNADYFLTAWTRQKNIMLREKIILPTQTLYSFRHSAAVYCFTNKQNLRLLQGLMGHQTPDVTIKYLRSLGFAETSSVDDLPRLPGH